MSKKVYLAVDLGAGSGRVMAGIYDGKTIQLEEVTRWASEPVKVGDSYHWDVNQLYKYIVDGVKKAKGVYGDAIVSLGIDTWGVDYGLLDDKGEILNLPYIYRDSRTDGMMDSVFKLVPKADIYRETGIQFMFFNTIFQIRAEVEKGGNIGRAKSFLMMPDLLAYMLTGVKVNERTNASTTQFYNPFKRDWAWDIIEKIGAPVEIFKNGFVECGDVIGSLKDELKAELGDIKVVAVASHDTGSAVAATPTQAKVPAYINSGTWSLPGIETPTPVSDEAAFKENFTNEVGVENTIRFLKNVTGMWLVQKSKEVWKAKGIDKSYQELEAAALEAEPFRTVFNPDDPDFVMPADMPAAIAEHSKKTGQPVPETHGQIFRAIQESIALKYAFVFDTIERLTGQKVNEINIMGGGSKDAVLNQFTADATGRKVIAGPTESTALGNVIMQMKGSGDIKDVREGRAIIANSVTPKVFEPKPENAQMWKDAFAKFKKDVLKA